MGFRFLFKFFLKFNMHFPSLLHNLNRNFRKCLQIRVRIFNDFVKGKWQIKLNPMPIPDIPNFQIHTQIKSNIHKIFVHGVRNIYIYIYILLHSSTYETLNFWKYYINLYLNIDLLVFFLFLKPLKGALSRFIYYRVGLENVE